VEGHDRWETDESSIKDYFIYALQGAKMIQIYAPAGLMEQQAKFRVLEILDMGIQAKP